MAVKSIADLKADMPAGVPASISAQDIHNLIDTLESRTSVSVLKTIQVKTTSYTTALSDSGSVIVFDTSAPVTLTLPNSLPAGWHATVAQAGVGQVTVAVTGGTLQNIDSHTKLEGQSATANLLVTSNSGATPIVFFSGETAGDTAGPRLDITAVSDVLAVWDASDPASRNPADSTSLTSLASRSSSGTLLTAASAGGGSVSTVLSDPAFIRTTGGNSMRRLDAPADVADNMFASGGMLIIAARAANPSGVLIAKLAEVGGIFNGWLIYAPDASTLSIEYYVGAAPGGTHSFSFPPSATDFNIIEIEWNTDAANISPVVRVNGLAVTLNSQTPGAAVVDDSGATLVVGNRNWGTQATPWSGDIGEIMVFASVPTADQKTAIYNDISTHWPTAAAAPLPGPIDLSQYTMTFNEDFTGPLSRVIPGDASTDGNQWITSFGNGAVRWLGSPPERQIYIEPEYAGTKGTPLGINPFSVADSVLTITCAPVSEADAPYLDGKEFTSGMITTAGSFGQLFGYFEMKARFEGLGVTGTWPAFWLLFHGTASSEFDILEAYGVNPTAVFQTTHQATGSSGIETAFDWTTGWHTYGLKWTSTELVYYIDGVPTGRKVNSTFTPGYLIANLALEGRLDRVPDPANFPVEMKIDWIRAYQPL